MVGHLPDGNAVPLGVSAAQTYRLVGTAIGRGFPEEKWQF